MTKIEPKTLKGFRDFLPSELKKRNYVIETLKSVFESFGFEPLETPSLEYEEILTGKYGDEGDKLMYKFEDNGKRKVAMRYDQTVPLSRAIAQYQNEIYLPFKRYQIQNVWRAENTQKGRYREFLQVDVDIVGTYSPLADAEILTLTAKCLEKLGFNDYKLIINDRKVFMNLVRKNLIAEHSLALVLRAIDKIKKIGEEGVLEEFGNLGIDKNQRKLILGAIREEIPSEQFTKIFEVLTNSGIKQDNFEFNPTLARGLDYYTGLIFEVEVKGYDVGSVAGGGRYDNLIGMFAGRNIPAVGFAFGFDRLIEAMEELNLFPKSLNGKTVFVAFSTSDLQEKALEITTKLREKNINAEFYLEDTSLEKQLKYADKKQIQYSIIIDKENLVLKNMQERTQKTLPLEEIIKKLA